jgi:hypothetical protein
MSQVHITARSTHDHDEPEEISVPLDILQSEVQDERMAADVKWTIDAASQYSAIDTNEPKQPWIWAVGPKISDSGSGDGDERKRDGSPGFEQHSSYGTIHTISSPLMLTLQVSSSPT